MKNILKLTTAAAAILGLSACDMLGLNKEGESNATANAATNSTAGNTTADAGGKDPANSNVATASTPVSGGPVTAAFLVGRWTDNNDCSNYIEFSSDSSFRTSDGQGQGIWALDGDRLTFQGARTITSRVQAPDANTITLIHADGSLGRSTRCP